MSSQEYEFHKLANKLPFEKGVIAQIQESIKERGQKNPIVLFEEKILDGRLRYTACKNLGVTPTFRYYDIEQEGNPADFVMVENVDRRHLSATQRAEAAYNLKYDRDEYEPKESDLYKQEKEKGEQRKAEGRKRGASLGGQTGGRGRPKNSLGRRTPLKAISPKPKQNSKKKR